MTVNTDQYRELTKQSLGPCCNKDKSTSEPATREDVVALFMTCVHLLVPLTLMRNPQEFADKAQRTPANQKFKEDPTPRRIRDFVLNSVTKKRRPVPGASIWEAV